MSVVCFVRARARRSLLAGRRVPWIHNNARAAYIAAVCVSAPPWADRVDLELLRTWARMRTIVTGEMHVLDHIVPITHPRVCGLTVPWNLQVLHWRANGSKGNTWCPEQMELFE